jgi:hypothetical protein
MKNTDYMDLPPFLDDGERECCKDTEVPPEGRPHNCVDVWRIKLKAAINELEGASAAAAKAEKAYQNATDWEAKLKAWMDDAGKAHGQIQSVVAGLARFLAMVIRMQRNTGKSVRTIEVLLCLVKRIFDELRGILLTTNLPDEDLGKLQDLLRYIDCNPDLDEAKKQDARKCVLEFQPKIQAVHALQEALLKKLLEVLKAAHLIRASMGNWDRQPFGLKWHIEDLLKRLSGEATAKQKTDLCICRGSPPKGPTVEPPCGNDISSPSARLLPIMNVQAGRPAQQAPGYEAERGGAYSVYYQNLEWLYKEATGTTGAYRRELNEARKSKDSFLARKVNLEEAIKAAEAAVK